jgi:hypothetical protein
MWGSSMAEQPAVNRLVVGSSPTPTAMEGSGSTSVDLPVRLEQPDGTFKDHQVRVVVSHNAVQMGYIHFKRSDMLYVLGIPEDKQPHD